MANKNQKRLFDRIISFLSRNTSDSLSPSNDIESIVKQYNDIVQSKIQNEFIYLNRYVNVSFKSDKNRDGTIFSKYMKVLRNQFGRYYRYLTYIQMVEFTPELKSALDTYVDYISNSFGSTNTEAFTFEPINQYLIGFDDNIISDLTKKLHLLAFNWGLDKLVLRKIIKYLIKFGDCFIAIKWKNNLKYEKGIDHIKVVPPYLIRPVFNTSGKLLGYNLEKESSFISFVKQGNFASDSATSATPSFDISYVSSKDIYNTPENSGHDNFVDVVDDDYFKEHDVSLTPMEVLHLTIDEDEYSPFGTSILDKVRRVWKQMIMLEDLLLLFRLTRGIQRRVYKIDVGKGKSPQQAMEEVETIKNFIKRKPVVDPVSGHVDLGADLMDITDDIWIPINKESSQTSVEKLDAQDDKGIIDDIKYFQDKIFAGLRVPKALLTYEEDINAKATLVTEDQAFARIVEAKTEEIEAQITKLFHLHAYASNDELLLLMNFKLPRAVNIFEKEKLNLLSDRLNVASSMQEFATMEYIQSEILKLPQEVIDKFNLKKQKEESEGSSRDNINRFQRNNGNGNSVSMEGNSDIDMGEDEYTDEDIYNENPEFENNENNETEFPENNMEENPVENNQENL